MLIYMIIKLTVIHVLATQHAGSWVGVGVWSYFIFVKDHKQPVNQWCSELQHDTHFLSCQLCIKCIHIMLCLNMLVVFNITGLFFYINHFFIYIKSLAFKVYLTGVNKYFFFMMKLVCIILIIFNCFGCFPPLFCV